MEVIGVDIGGTAIKGAIISSNGDWWEEINVPTRAKNGKNEILSGLMRVISELLNKKFNIVGIGIGSAGNIDHLNGIVDFASENLPGWSGVCLQSVIEETYKLPVVVDNDANMALLGEMWCGSHPHTQSVVMVTLGTGVGGANMFDGKLSRGASFKGGNWGHSNFVPGGRLCNCGRKGCVEAYLSGTAFVERACEQTGRCYRHGADVFNDYQHRVADVVPVVQSYIQELALFIDSLAEGLNPEMFLIGGGVIHAKEIWWEDFQKCLKQNPQPSPLVRSASLGNRAGIYGAASTIIKKVEGKEF
ncbi:transcriptional regulator [Salipaludibacillus keqinensis]|uniref:Transcriptional regulator n=1 Tax=Salipaludibacillus keqinensis TaxID=2045207 RepID=A0A323TJ71_9BACI|nr:ROK family protein [Salipaludibacillus keqinensis]PYZ92743.1 transcriptional regulator [Salipaludibacillus keqinensis]